VFTTAGAATALSGLALWLWSDSFYSELESNYEQLDQDKPAAPTRSEEVAPVLDHARQVGQTEGGFDSVKRLDVVAGSLIGIGAACLATGILWYLLEDDDVTPSDEKPADVAIVPHGVRLRW
jgi:hypothetical protein